MDLLAGLFLLEGHCAQDRRRNHARSVDERERTMKPNRAAALYARHFWREYRKVSRCKVQSSSRASKCRVKIQVGLRGHFNCLPVSAFGTDHGTGDERCRHRNCRNQPQLLVNLEHVRTLVEQSLQLNVRLGLLRCKAKVTERRRIALLRAL